MYNFCWFKMSQKNEYKWPSLHDTTYALPSSLNSFCPLYCRTSEQCPHVVSLLSESFNPHVRCGAAMALGIACAGTGNKVCLVWECEQSLYVVHDGHVTVWDHMMVMWLCEIAWWSCDCVRSHDGHVTVRSHESVSNHCMALGESHPQTIAPLPPSILQFWHFVGFAVHHWKFLCNTGMTCVLASTWAKLYTCSHFSEIVYDPQPADLIAWMAKIASKLICAIVKSFNVQSCMTGYRPCDIFKDQCWREVLPEVVGHGWPLLIRSLTRVPFKGL